MENRDSRMAKKEQIERNITVEITTGKNNIGLKKRLVYSYWKCPGRIDPFCKKAVRFLKLNIFWSGS